MDGNRFDDLSRKLATGLTRRKALKGAATGLLGALGLRKGVGAEPSVTYCGNNFCATDPGICKDGCVCCIYRNSLGEITNDRCLPPSFCGTGGTPTCGPNEVLAPNGGGCVPKCTSAANCPQPAANSCQRATCSAGGVCGFTAVANDTACGANRICCGGTCVSRGNVNNCRTCGTRCTGATPVCNATLGCVAGPTTTTTPAPTTTTTSTTTSTTTTSTTAEPTTTTTTTATPTCVPNQVVCDPEGLPCCAPGRTCQTNPLNPGSPFLCRPPVTTTTAAPTTTTTTAEPTSTTTTTAEATTTTTTTAEPTTTTTTTAEPTTTTTAEPTTTTTTTTTAEPTTTTTTSTTTTTTTTLFCTPGSTQPCYTGPAGTQNVGVCVGGIRTCNQDGSGFGDCVGQVLPGTEVCDGFDNDCDGTVDEGDICPPSTFCVSGACVQCRTVADCATPANFCQEATCSAGTCVVQNKADTTPCSDGNVCTVNDTCQAGTCTGTQVVCNTPPGACYVSPGTCTPANGCTYAFAASGTTCGTCVLCDTMGNCNVTDTTSPGCVPCGGANATCTGGAGSQSTCCTGFICNESGRCEAPCDPSNPTGNCLCQNNSGVCPQNLPCCINAGNSTPRCGGNSGNNCACVNNSSCTDIGNRTTCCQTGGIPECRRPNNCDTPV